MRRIIIIILLFSSIAFMGVSLGCCIRSMYDEYWIDYVTSTTTTGTTSGFPSTTVRYTVADIGLFYTCYIVVTTIIISTGFSTTTSSSSSSDCTETEKTGYIDSDTVKTIQRVGIVSAVFIGLAILSGIACVVLFLLKKIIKPINFVPVGIAGVSTLMLLVAIVVLNNQLLTGMTFGSTSNLGIVALVFSFLATVGFTVAAIFIVKLPAENQTKPLDKETKPKETLTMEEVRA